MADEFRLRASVDDGFTGPLSKFKGALQSVRDDSQKHVGAMRKDFEGFRGAISGAQGVLSGFTGPLAALGLAGGGAALSLSAMGGALTKFSASTQNLSNLSKNTGIAVDSLRALVQMGDRVGVSGETMMSAADNFARAGTKLKNNWGEAMQQLPAMNLSWMLNDLKEAKSAEDMLKRLLTDLPKINDIEARRRVGMIFFGTEDIDKIVTEYGTGAAKKFEEIRQRIGSLGPETEKAAKDFQENLGRMGDAVEKLKLKTLGPALRGITGLIDDADKNGLGGNADEQALRRQLSPLERPGATDRERLEGRRSSVEAQKRLLEANPNSPDYARRHDRMVQELKRVADELEKLRSREATVQQQSFNGDVGGGGATFQRAGYNGTPIWGGMGGGKGPLSGYGPSPDIRSGGPLSRYGGPPSVGRSPLDSMPPPLAGTATGAVPPRGDGRGTPHAARTSQMMGYAMDQLRREGVPEANLRQAAAHLVGQATMESGLDPNKVHDNGTGLGIYGARDPKGWGSYKGARRSDMVRWLEANGYARNSAEGQMREMAHSAMNGGYDRTRNVLMGNGTGNVDLDTDTITKDFEKPYRINRRSGAVRSAMQAGPADGATVGGGGAVGLDGQAGVDLGNGTMRMPNGHIRSKTYGTGPGPAADVPGSGDRPGDEVMRRLYGSDAPVARAPMQEHRMSIELHGFPSGTRARTSMGDLFRETTVSRHRPEIMNKV